MPDILTGEAVVLELSVAQFSSRIAALLLDLVVQGVALITGFVAAGGARNAAWAAAISVSSYVLVLVGYPTIFETVSRGRSLGKLAVGLRVVSDDGSPERFRQALIRALSGLVEIWSPLMAVGLITALLNGRGKRLGDIFAGTFVIQERVPRRRDLDAAFAAVPPPLVGWAASAELSRLSDQSASAAGSYLRRYYQLRPAFRDQLGLELAATVAGQVSPPPPAGTPPAAFLAAVLAVRRDRESARLAGQQAARADWAAAVPVAGDQAPGPATLPAEAGAPERAPEPGPARQGPAQAEQGAPQSPDVRWDLPG